MCSLIHFVLFNFNVQRFVIKTSVDLFLNDLLNFIINHLHRSILEIVKHTYYPNYRKETDVV